MPPLLPVTKAFMLACVGFFCLLELLPGFGPLLALWPLNSGMFMPWQVITHVLLHRDVLHLAVNMFGLWMFGSELERVWGGRRYALILLAATLSTASVVLLLSWVTASLTPSIGASGALFGLLLSYAMLFPNRIILPLIPPIPMKVKYFVAIFGGLELILGFNSSSGLAHFAHLGGMLGAWLLIRHWRTPRRRG
ncbi:MAG: rhomboid family intramembrane serine protease [Burkholderiales bacterium]|nr:MAG: rhomboid family intramembrane serine protease [Burkholderiales bacterium]